MNTMNSETVLAGNYFNKYESNNPVVRVLMRGYLDALESLIRMTGQKSILEIGCGEGYVSRVLAKKGFRIRATDLSSDIIQKAQALTAEANLDVEYYVKNIYELSPESDASPLVLCCEVMEHLPEPNRALDILSSIAKPYIILSVPREPVWRMLNMARAKYLSDFGNTPGHIQHWSKNRFLSLIQRRFTILSVKTPFPWTMVLCKTA